MRSTLGFLLAAFLTTIHAQVIVTPPNGTFDCQGFAAGQNFCAGPSLASPIIIRCVGTVDVVGNCDDDLANVAPAGVKPFAPCYQPSPSGGAVCSYEGIGYPDNGAPFNISNDAPIATSSSSSTSTAISSTTSTTTSPIPLSAIPTASTVTLSTLTTSSTSSTATTPSPNTTPSSAVTSTIVISTTSVSTTIVYVYPTPSGTIATAASSAASSPRATPFQGGAAKVVGMWVPVALCMLRIIIV